MKDGKSLKFMSAEPKMYIAAKLANEIKEQVFKECASRTYEIDNEFNKDSLLTPLSFDSDKQSLNETCNLAASAVLKGSEYIWSLLQYSVESLMVCGCDKALVVEVETMDLLKAININTGVDTTYSNLQLHIPLIPGHMIPGTGFKFMLELYDSQLVTLRTIETGKRQTLIQGSPAAPVYNPYPCSFFLKCGDGYEFHFCTVNQEKGTTVNSWYRWFLGKDFFSTLNAYGKLPLEMDVKKFMDTIKQGDDYKQQRDDYKKQRDHYKQQRDDLKLKNYELYKKLMSLSKN